MKLIRYLRVVVPLVACLLVVPSHARPTAPQAFCEYYSSSVTCSEGVVTCTQCHIAPPVLNVYGQSLQASLNTLDSYRAETFVESLLFAFDAVSDADSDSDGEANGLEIAQGTLPGDANSHYQAEAETLVWDAEYALHKTMILFCGHSPRYPQKQTFLQQADKSAALHAQLSECLSSDYWQNEALHRLADKRIRPLFELGLNGAIGIGDYQWDYRLFSYVMSEDRDVRDLLLAEYHIDELGDVVTGVIPRQRPLRNSQTGQLSLGSGQPLVVDQRAGMISTQWFFSYFTMFAQLPRNTASQAYRAYLGLDIAKSEGLMPVAGEPRDVDSKGVDAPECAVCHSTLDPLAYAFSAYAGVEETPSDSLSMGNPYGTYYPEGTDWEADSYLFGQPVQDLKDWADQAANSDEFKKNITQIFFTYAIGRSAGVQDKEEFETLWKSMEADNYSANKLIHRLVDTLVFGGK